MTGSNLTKREEQCLSYYIQGYTAKEIASFFNLSIRTVENYIYNVKQKLNVSTKTDLIYKVKNVS